MPVSNRTPDIDNLIKLKSHLHAGVEPEKDAGDVEGWTEFYVGIENWLMVVLQLAPKPEVEWVC